MLAKILLKPCMKGNIRHHPPLAETHACIRCHAVERQFAQEFESMYAFVDVAEVFGNIFGGGAEDASGGFNDYVKQDAELGSDSSENRLNIAFEGGGTDFRGQKQSDWGW
jgi:hypothetical protein